MGILGGLLGGRKDRAEGEHIDGDSLLFFFLLLVVIFCNCGLFEDSDSMLFFLLLLVVLFCNCGNL